MKILFVNKYFFRKGGSEMAFFDTAELLEKKGHQVIFFSMEHPLNVPTHYARYFVSHVDLNANYPVFRQLRVALRFIYSLEARKKVAALLLEHKPDLVHLHNFHHQISPSILAVFRKHNLPVIMTLHDYKLVCPIYTLFTNGKTCEACRRGRYYWCLWKKCTKGSTLKSALSMVESYINNSLFRFHDWVDVFISPSKFLVDKLREMGFPRKVHHLPNFINLWEYEPTFEFSEKSVVYFGRLSYEKGLVTLIQAAAKTDVLFKVIGDGPLRRELEERVKRHRLVNVRFFGHMTGDLLKQEVQSAMAVVIPADWYENCPRTIIEAYALGKPVIGSRQGGIPELIIDNETGLTFAPRDSEALAKKVNELAKDPKKVQRMGKNAREFAENNLNAEDHYIGLIKLYTIAMERHR